MVSKKHQNIILHSIQRTGLSRLQRIKHSGTFYIIPFNSPIFLGSTFYSPAIQNFPQLRQCLAEKFQPVIYGIENSHNQIYSTEKPTEYYSTQHDAPNYPGLQRIKHNSILSRFYFYFSTIQNFPQLRQCLAERFQPLIYGIENPNSHYYDIEQQGREKLFRIGHNKQNYPGLQNISFT